MSPMILTAASLVLFVDNVRAQTVGEIAAGKDSTREAQEASGAERVPRVFTNRDFPPRPADGALALTVLVKGLHYPSASDPESVRLEAEANLDSVHYRRAIQKLHPRHILPDRVDRVEATARRAEEVKGFEMGIVVDALVSFDLSEADAEALSIGGESGPLRDGARIGLPESPSAGVDRETARPSHPQASGRRESRRYTYRMPCSGKLIATCSACVTFQTRTHPFDRTGGEWRCREEGLATLVEVRNTGCTMRNGDPVSTYEVTCAP